MRRVRPLFPRYALGRTLAFIAALVACAPPGRAAPDPAVIPSLYAFGLLAGTPQRGDELRSAYHHSDRPFYLLDEPVAIDWDAHDSYFVLNAGSGTVLNTLAHYELARPSQGGLVFPGLLDHPRGLAATPAGNIHVADTGHHVIRRIGHATPPNLPDLIGAPDEPGFHDGPADIARFNAPTAMDFDYYGTLYVLDSGNRALRRVSPAGAVSTYPLTLPLDDARGIEVASSGQIFISTGDRVIQVEGNLARTLATGLAQPSGLAYRPASGSTPASLLIAETGRHRILELFFNGRPPVVFAGSGAPGLIDGPLLQAVFDSPTDIAIHPRSGAIYITDSGNHRIRHVTYSNGPVIKTVGAFYGLAAHRDAVGPDARFDHPEALLAQPDGTLVADTANHVLRLVSDQAATTTLAGRPDQPGHADGPAADARFASPSALVSASATVVLVADADNHALRRFDRASGLVSTLAGAPNEPGHIDGPAADARFRSPRGLARSTTGDLYIADSGNHVIRRLAADTGIVSTFAGLPGTPGLADGAGADARFDTPLHLAFDSAGRLHVADSGNGRIRVISPDGAVSTLAQPDGSPLAFTRPHGLLFNPRDDLFISDAGSHTLWLKPAGLAATRLAGTPGVRGGRIADWSAPLFDSPAGLAFDSSGRLLLADAGNSVIVAAQPRLPALHRPPSYPYLFLQYNQPWTLTLAASPFATSLRVEDGPPGLAYDPATGAYSGVPTQAGLYATRFIITNPAGIGVTTLSIRVNPANATITPASERVEVIYDGNPQPFAGWTTNPADVPLSVHYLGDDPDQPPYPLSTEPPVDAGRYWILLQSADPNHAAWHSVALTIRPAAHTLVFPAAPAHSLDAGPLALQATASSGAPVIYHVVSGPGRLSDGQLSPVAAGEIVVRASVAPVRNHLPVDPVEQTFTILPGAETPRATITLGDLEQTYDGSPRAVTVATEPPGLDVRLTYDGLDTAPTEGGTYLVVASIESAERRAGASALLTIGRATPAVEFVGATEPVYDGTGHRLLARARVGENWIPIPVVFRTQGYEFPDGAPVNAGEYVYVARLDDRNILAAGTATMRIRKAPLVVTSRALMLRGHPVPALPVYYSETLRDPIDLPPVPVCAATSSSPPGQYPITFTPGHDNNYELIVKEGVLTISPPNSAYTAILHGVGLVRIQLAKDLRSFTGRLELAHETKLIALRGKLAPTAPSGRLSGSWTASSPAGSTATPLSVSFSIGDYTSLHVSGGVPQFASHFVEMPPLVAPSSTEGRAWAGRYTVHLPRHAVSTSAPGPGGMGGATATISTQGALALRGHLGDGKAFTLKADPDEYGHYAAFVRPYGARLQSYLYGLLPLAAHPALPGRRLLTTDQPDNLLFWARASSRDAAYTQGFGQILLTPTLDPWLAPVAAKKATKTAPAVPAITLADRLGLATAAFGLDYLPHDGAALTEAQIDGLPAALALTMAGKPLPPKPNPAKLALKVNSATGAFSGSFVLTDPVPAPTTKAPDATKSHPRKVTFSGVLRQPPAGETDRPIGQGVFLLPALPGAASTEQVSGEIRLMAP